MAVRANGDLQVTSLVLRKDQVQRMEELRQRKSTKANKLSKSDIAREVFEAGLDVLFFAPSSIIDASNGNEPEAA